MAAEKLIRRGDGLSVRGGRLIDEDPHLDRLDRSLRELRIASPMSRKPLKVVLREVLARNPEVAFYEAEIAAAKGERKSAGVLANPEFGTIVSSSGSALPDSTSAGTFSP